MSNNKRILIVEDDDMLAEFLKLNLENDGYEVIASACSGEESIELARSVSPDLIIMDINLGGQLTGPEAVDAISKFANIPVIYTSGDAEQNAINQNPYGYLLKPINYAQLSIVIKLAFERYALEQKLISYQAHLDQAQQLGNMGSWEWDITNNDLIWSDHIFRLFGYKPQSFTPTYPKFLARIHPDDRQQVEDAVNNAVQNNHPYEIDHRILTPDGQIRYVHEIGHVSYNNNQQPIRMIGTVLDITERKIAEEKIKQLAYHDSLTGLPNRSLLLDRLEIQLATAKRHKTKFALLFIDLDGFKQVNDQYGHKMGDKLLQEVACRLEDSTRKMDTVARIGGDEFVVLVNELVPPNAVQTVSEKILQTINRPFQLHSEITVNVSASIGVAIYPDDGHSADDLLTCSDNAMYSAKKEGKNRVRLSS